MEALFASHVIPALVATAGPIVVAFSKKYGPLAVSKVPKAFLPVVSALISTIAGLLAGYSIPGLPTYVSAPIVGLASVGVREIFDQVKQAYDQSRL